MSMKVYEIAAVLHKDSMRTLNDFQEMGLEIRRLDDNIPDEYSYQLAKKYGRHEYMLPFLTKEFFMANRDEFIQMDLSKLIPEFSAGNRMSKRKAAVTIWLMNELLEERTPLIAELKPCKLSKAYRAFEFMGDDDQALVKTDGTIQMYFIPKGGYGEQKCRLCFGEDEVFDICLCPEECRILFYADGRYYYEQVEWNRIDDIFYLNMDFYLNRKGVKLPDSSIFSDTCDLKKAVRYVHPCENGFAVQSRKTCTLYFDRDRLQICHGNIIRISWQAPMQEMTVNGRLSVRLLSDELMGRYGEVSRQEICGFLENMNAVFFELYDRYKDIYLKKIEDQKKHSKKKKLKNKDVVDMEPQLLPKMSVLTRKDCFECDLNKDTIEVLLERINRV